MVILTSLYLIPENFKQINATYFTPWYRQRKYANMFHNNTNSKNALISKDTFGKLILTVICTCTLSVVVVADLKLVIVVESLITACTVSVPSRAVDISRAVRGVPVQPPVHPPLTKRS